MQRIMYVLQLKFKKALLSDYFEKKYNVANHEKLQVLVPHIVCGVGGEGRQVKFYSRPTCVQKRQECKFVPRLLFMIVANLNTIACVNQQ